MDSLVLCVPARDEAESLPYLLGLLRASTLWQRSHRRVVWIGLNGCTDDSAEQLAALAGPEVRVLQLAEPGKNRTWNALMQACGAPPVVFFVDAEVAPAPDCLERLWEAMGADPELQMASARPLACLDRLPDPDDYQRARVDFGERDWLRRGSGAQLPRANCYALRPPPDFQLPEHPNLGDDLFLSLRLRWRVVETARVYFSPPSREDHVRQRIRQRLGIRALKRDFPELARELGGPPGRLPSVASLAELVFWLRLLAVEREARQRAVALDPDRPCWPRIHSARPPQAASSSHPARPSSLRARCLRPLQALVLRLADWPLWTGVYAAVAGLARWALESLPGVQQLRIQGSLARSQLVPGLSDIDADVILEDLPAEVEARMVPDILQRYQRLRWFFPILQEPTLLRRSECDYCVRAGEPWSLTSRYQNGVTPGGRNRQAYLGLFLRRYLRFYTRQALAGLRHGADRYVKLHAHELASVQALLARPQAERLQVGSLQCGAELGELYEHYCRLKAQRFLARDHQWLGPRLATLAFGLLRRLAGAGGVPRGPQRAQPEPWMSDWLAPFSLALAEDEHLGGFAQVLSSAAGFCFQHRYYLVVPEHVGLPQVEIAWHRLGQIWRRYEHKFPSLYFGVFPHPSLLPEAALRLVHLNYAGSLEPYVLHRDGWQLPLPHPNLLQRDLAEGALPGLRRWQSRRDRVRWLDFYGAMLPAALLWLEQGELHWAEPAQAYQARCDDEFAALLAQLPSPRWFEGPHWDSDLPQRSYAIVRRQLDRLMRLGGAGD